MYICMYKADMYKIILPLISKFDIMFIALFWFLFGICRDESELDISW